MAASYNAEICSQQNRAFMQFSRLQVRCYSPEEVRQISVMEVTQPNTFDEAGFPVRGGLYDPLLGPSEGEHCDSCGLSGQNCPGHFGHIQLTVPVFNPLLFSFTYNLAKGTCIHCHRFTYDTNSSEMKIIVAKLRALQFGLSHLLNGLEGQIRMRVASSMGLLSDRIDILGENAFLDEVDTLLAEMAGINSVEMLRRRTSDSQFQQNMLKNNVAERSGITKEFLKRLFARKVRCPRCKRANGQLRNETGRIFLLDFSKQTNVLAKTAERRKDATKITKLLATHRAEELSKNVAPFGRTTDNGGGALDGFENSSALMMDYGLKRDKFDIGNDFPRPDLGFMEQMDEGDNESISLDFKPDMKDLKPVLKNQSATVLATSLLDPLLLSEQLLAQQLQKVVAGKCEKLAWRAAEVREHLRLVWQKEGFLLKQLFPFFDEVNPVDPQQQQLDQRPMAANPTAEKRRRSPIDMLFIELVLVEPSKFRPIRYLAGERYEHPATVNLRKLVEADQLLTLVKMELESGAGMANKQLGLAAKELVAHRLAGKTLSEKLHNAYLELQMRANALYDQGANKLDGKGTQPGLRQTLEKKEGLFRMNMMGKRVNYSCRSVITPDPYLDVDEIGIPELFARRLTFPEPVSHLNLQKLKQLVRNGPNVHQGANFIDFSGTLGKPPFRYRIPPDDFQERTSYSRHSLRIKLGETNNVHAMPDYVLRHLQNGDLLLMNRQPSLHKPSIMGHRARVLHGDKALRMNYAPCKAYNADFDGDEMNGHFLQNRVAQCEAGELANLGNNFLVPKDGTPILGLIQDHVVSGVMMTIRGQFFSREDFMHLVLAAFAQTGQRLQIPPPAMIKPEQLWSGKQVISAIMMNCCPADCPRINLTGKSKTSVACWKARDPATGKELPAPGFKMSESEVVFRHGELLSGVLDKAHYGSTQFGLIHCCQELYGPRVAIKILSCFSRLFTTYLQYHGFSLGVGDILVRKEADKRRRTVIKQLRECGDEVVRKTFGLAETAGPQQLRRSLASAYNHPRDRTAVKMVDYTMKQAMNKFAEQINSACVPSGLIRDFPSNSLQLMIQSGSKGSLVNSIQISCALGQIELEGQRPPLSVTGRSLPSFRCFDPSPRAGGFVDQRFLTGINPQELFFHTMAGREGLIDTAVKTSRSGYLQRCVIKHLEGLVVRYDHTVRDHDNSVVQFRYGEDGLDVGKSTFLHEKHFPFLAQNLDAVRRQFSSPNKTIKDNEHIGEGENQNEEEKKEDEDEKWHTVEAEKQFGRISKFKRRQMRKRASILAAELDDGKSTTPAAAAKVELATATKGRRDSAFNEFCRQSDTAMLLKESVVAEWENMSPADRAKYVPRHAKAPAPVDVRFNPATTLGALPEHILEQLDDYVQRNEQQQEQTTNSFKRSIYWKGLRALADPGECVGLLAAQSIGEPSTQMTLNTFHFAGRGEMNVTLGIPRLREILMTQGKRIATPMAEISIRPDVTNEQIEQIKTQLNPVLLREVLKHFKLEETAYIDQDGNCFRDYILSLDFLSAAKRDHFTRHLKRSRILRELEHRFGKHIAFVIGKRFRDVQAQQQIVHRKLKAKADVEGDDPAAGGGRRGRHKEDEDLASDEEDAMGGVKNVGGELDAHEARLSKRHLDDAAEYEGEEEDRQDAGIADVDLDDDVVELGKNELPVEEEEEAEEKGDEEDDNASVRLDGGRAPRKVAEMSADRVEAVLNSNPLIVGYTYDAQTERWCSFRFRLPIRNRSAIDVLALVEREIDAFVLTQVSGVEKCIVREEDRNGRTTRILQTQGINLEAFFSRSSMLDSNTIYSNDIDLMLRNYGIEAAMRTIVKEMNNVFGVYGIEVNPRHLTLTADYMTFTGIVQPFNRGAMESSASPLQKMTFETTMSFMRQAIVNGQPDSLHSPSARVMMGQLIRGGTGSFELLARPNYVINNGEAGQGGGQQQSANAQQFPRTEMGTQIEEMRKRRRRRKMKYFYGQDL